MFSTIKNRMNIRRHDGELDSGDVVQAVLLIAGFVIITVLVVLWVGAAVMNKGSDAA